MEEQNTTPVAPAEPAPVKSDEPIVLGGEKKTSKGMIAGLIVLAIVAVTGIAFGIIELMQVSNKDKEIADLNQQVTNCANAGNNSDTAEKIEVTCPDGTQMEVENTTETVDTKEYIYVGEWGIKIKIPEKLKYINYSYNNYISDGNNEYSEDYSTISFNGIAADSDKTAAKEYLRQAVINNCYVARVARVSKGESRTWGEIVYEDDVYNYVYNHAQVACSDGTNDSTLAETEGNILIVEMLTDKKNYSKV